jgi:acetyl esterase/lipase
MGTKSQILTLMSVSLSASVSAACSSQSNELILNAGKSPSHPETMRPSPVLPSEPSGANESAHQNDSDATQTTPPAPPNLCNANALPRKQTLDVQYQQLSNVDPNLQSLDIYFPAVENPCQGVPVVIWIHGGAWMLGDKANVDSKAKAEHFNLLGYGFVSVNYRLSPDLRIDSRLNPNRIKFPDHPNDVGAAVAWIHKNIKKFGGDNQKLALLGHSAGAHLAALVSQDQSYIQKADPTWDPKSLRCLGSYDTEGYNISTLMQQAGGQTRLIYRNAFGDDPAQWSAASPINFVKEYGMAIQLAKRGEQDRQTQLENFKIALEGKGNKVSVINAQTLTHEEVNRVIGALGDTVMTPYVTDFITKSCFPK